ncbi:MAG: hypothetical protein KF773_40465 [Deltaproteobacteria bacterium]|nr:hypothetical protein [Deltaproteobacteria bacterium]MCW5806556.1 hypothetical protein [Deltaproteobacteria bacterium]
MARRGRETVPVRYDTPRPRSLAKGSFGAFQQTWEITDYDVRIARRWWPIVLAPLVPLGLYILWLSHAEEGDGVAYFCLGVAVLVLGGAAVLATPLRPPASVTCTREGVQFGRRWAPADRVRRVVIEHVLTTTRYQQRHGWRLVIRIAGDADREAREAREEWLLPIAHESEDTPLAIGRVADAMRQMLGIVGWDDQTKG